MIISEAVDTAADRKGSYLSGAPGKLLWETLTEAGINRKDVYVTHAIKCIPNEKIQAAELKACKPYLLQEIEEVDPQIIVTLGATALKALSRGKITELHGQILTLGSRSLIPTFSPGVALRDPSKLPALRQDLTRVSLAMKGEVVTEDDLHWSVIRTPKQWNEFLDEFQACKGFACDIETTGLDSLEEGAAINSIQFGLDNDKNYALPLSARDSPWKKELHYDMLKTLVDMSQGKTVVGQNFKFDNTWLRRIYGLRFPLTADTQLMHHLLDENSPHGLKSMATTYCGAPSYDVDLKTKLGQGDMTKFYKYGCFDTHYTWKLYKIFRAQLLKQPSLRRLFYKLVMPASKMFEDIEQDGLCIDLERLDETERRLTERKEQLLKELNAEAGREINWNSPAQVSQLLFDELKLPILETTGAGKPSTGESSLLRLKDRSPIAAKLVEYRGVEKNLSTYVIGWRKLMHGDRLYMSTKLHGTVTGRYSSRLHQVPRDPEIRGHIIAPKGWVMVVADYSQIELRMAAVLSGDPTMRRAFATGQDIHTLTASVILSKEPSKLTKEERKMAKAVNFGLLYGMGWPKLVIYARDNYGVDMSDEQAQEFRKRYFETYPKLLDWHERQRRVVRAFGEVASLSGRIRHLPGIYSTDKGVRAEAERQAINSPNQGFGSGDMKAMAMVEIHNTLPRNRVMVRGEVHDSILLWIREGHVRSMVPRIKAIMESPSLLKDFGINLTVPIVADFEIGRWGYGVPLEEYDGD